MDDKILQLAGWFVCTVVGATAGIDMRIQRAKHSIHALIKDGWQLIEIQHEVEEFARTYPDMVRRIYMLEEIFVNKQPPNNLMEPDVFYYHNSLREVPPPVRITRVNDEFIREETKFYLEMKYRFTMNDLLEYWYTAMNIKPNPHMLKQDEGKYKYLLGIYNLDEILFAIDVSKSKRLSAQRPLLRNAFDLEKYVDDAREYILSKKNVHQMQGINRVIKREPVL